MVELEATVQSQAMLIEKLRIQLARLKRMQFGSSSEQLAREITQLELTLESLGAEAAPDAAQSPVGEDEPEPDPSTAQSRHPGRKPLPAHLPREDIRHLLGPHDQDCRCQVCGGTLRRAGKDEITEQLEWVPGHLKVLRHLRPKYSCTRCNAMAMPAGASRPIDRGLPGPGLLAHVSTSKFADHLPLYRQSQILARQGIELERSTLTDWVGAAHRLLAPLARELSRHVLSANKLHADDTPVPVLAPGLGRTKIGRLWGYVRDERASQGKIPPAVWFCYSADRKAIRPVEHLSTFKGILQADGYAGFDQLYERGSIQEAACWAHVRRKFFEIHQATASPLAQEALDRIGELYGIEGEIRGQPPDVRQPVRQARAGPKVDALHRWFLTTLRRVPEKSALALAIRYALVRWEALTRFIQDGTVEVDNNTCERELRAVAMGRKNYMFMGSDRGGERAATMYSLIGTCKLNGIDPEAYLRYVLARINDHKINALAELLPWNVAPLLTEETRQAA